MAGICSLNPTTLMTFKLTSKRPTLQIIHSVEVSIFKEFMELDSSQEQQIMKGFSPSRAKRGIFLIILPLQLRFLRVSWEDVRKQTK
ncbi:hypothetical protein NC651_029917 [Populus alba x Populus x berolinensis]|nr:hypothetical protein NC651_029917 [Populus alba x Populus x berolinensis]